jgi:hypothetical protein
MSASHQVSVSSRLAERFGKMLCRCLATATSLVLLVSASSAQRTSALTSVAAVTPSDAWAVGYTTVNPPPIVYAATLAEHWDGTKWITVSTPNPPGNCNALSAVGGVASNDLWAVGGVYYDVGNCGRGKNFPVVIEHWDGTVWKLVPSPRPNYKKLMGVAAISSNDVWAVGFAATNLGGYYLPLVEHWDGYQWKEIRSPTLQSKQAYFSSVTAVATNDVWAVGACGCGAENPELLVEHWDGTTWKIVPVPELGTFLLGASSANAHEVWATGSVDVALRWDGSRWTSTPVSNTNGSLNSVMAFHNGQAWAVGFQFNHAALTLTELWDGTAWTLVSSPNLSAWNNVLLGIAGTGVNDVWAVGEYDSRHTLVEHWDGTTWAVVPSP